MTYPTDVLELVPGPSQMLPNVLEALGTACGSSDLDPAFWDDYLALERTLQEFLHAKSCSVAIQSGEAMLALWGALKSTLKPGDVVGFADMAKALGADVRLVKCDWRKTIDVQALNDESRCAQQPGRSGETVANETTDGLFLVDFVSSAGGAPLNVDAWKIRLGSAGTSQGALGPPALAFTTVSEKAWKRINDVNLVAFDNIKQEGGIDAAIRRHAEVSAFARREVQETLGLKLYGEESAASPTVTAIELPEGCDWDALQEELHAQKLLVGGSYGPLKGKANKKVVAKAIKVMGLRSRR
ncbi:Pyridoxal phosphate-dependent transferase [Phytophthora cactorum]|nr:Pyridoxal phosphate-dependent transferase [Phytophthora cactorum]